MRRPWVRYPLAAAVAGIGVVAVIVIIEFTVLGVTMSRTPSAVFEGVGPGRTDAFEVPAEQSFEICWLFPDGPMPIDIRVRSAVDDEVHSRARSALGDRPDCHDTRVVPAGRYLLDLAAEPGASWELSVFIDPPEHR